MAAHSILCSSVSAWLDVFASIATSYINRSIYKYSIYIYIYIYIYI